MHGLHAARCLQPARPATALPRTRGDHGISDPLGDRDERIQRERHERAEQTAANTRSVRNAFWLSCIQIPRPSRGADVLPEHRADHRVHDRDPEPREEAPAAPPASAATGTSAPSRRAVGAQQVRGLRRTARGTRRAARPRSGRTSRARRRATLGASPNPNHSTNSGASATIGIVCDVTRSGSTARRSTATRSSADGHGDRRSDRHRRSPTTVSMSVGHEMPHSLAAERPQRLEDPHGPRQDDRAAARTRTHAFPEQEQQEQRRATGGPHRPRRATTGQPAAGRKSFVNSEA